MDYEKNIGYVEHFPIKDLTQVYVNGVLFQPDCDYEITKKGNIQFIMDWYLKEIDKVHVIYGTDSLDM